MTEMKMKIPYTEISETLKKVLSLSGSPGCREAREEQGGGASQESLRQRRWCATARW